jgi:hypothetical protein
MHIALFYSINVLIYVFHLVRGNSSIEKRLRELSPVFK